MFFASDNWAGAHPNICKALTKHSAGFSPAYGTDALADRVKARFDEIFERETAVFFTSTGTAANALALANYNVPGAVAFCHREAHLREDECGAPEFLAPGSRLRIVDGPDGKMSAKNLEVEINNVLDFGISGGKPAFVSITQATEAGTIHTLEEIDALAKVARRHELPVHMDGARFANALVALRCSPAEMTWKNGIDVVSFGGTKNGCWCAEALVFMNPKHAEQFAFLHKRSGQVISKARFIAAQFEAYFEDNLWLELASHANDMAALLENTINASNQLQMAWQRQVNEVFVIADRLDFEKMQAAGAKLYDWPTPYGLENHVADNKVIMRLVTSFATTPEEIKAFAHLTE